MKYIITLCLLIQLLNAAEFPDLNKHITLIWKGVDLTNVFDGSKTVSKDGEVDRFILCGPFDLVNPDGGLCDIQFSWAIQRGTSTSSGSGT